MLYLKNELMKWAVFHADTNLGKQKSCSGSFCVVVVNNGAVKSAISQDWLDELSWF